MSGGIKKIDELSKLPFATLLASPEAWLWPIKKQGDTAEAYGFYLAQMLIVNFDTTVAYAVGRRIYFEGQIYQVVTATTAAQTPHTNRAKFKWLGGAANQSNTASGSNSCTLNKTSGLVTFTSFVGTGAPLTCTIANSCVVGMPVTASVDLKLIYPTGDGNPFLQTYAVSGGNIVITIFNGNQNDQTNENLSILFNIQE